jgi:hypothetical protein
MRNNQSNRPERNIFAELSPDFQRRVIELFDVVQYAETNILGAYKLHQRTELKPAQVVSTGNVAVTHMADEPPAAVAEQAAPVSGEAADADNLIDLARRAAEEAYRLAGPQRSIEDYYDQAA